MDWASLAAFVAVAEHGGFSAAAGQLHLTQPAVSKRIAALEQSLQARLFDRLGRQVVLTEAGRALLPRARQMLAEAEAARRALQDLGQDIGGRLSLATSHHVGLHRLPALLRHFTALHPRGTYPSGMSWPESPQWGNFIAAFQSADMGKMLWSSVLIELGVVPISLFIATLAGFALGHLYVPFGRAIFICWFFCV